MTLESYLQLVGQLSTAVVFTMLLFSIVVVVTYYCYKAAETVIRKRNIYMRKMKKHSAFKLFNEPKQLQVVKKKAAAK